MNNEPKYESKLIQSERVRSVILAFVFILGAAIRFYDLTDAPLDFHSTRQLRSLLIARGMFAEHSDLYTSQERDIAVGQWNIEGLIEPPVMERLAAFTYQLLGQECFWAGRVYSILFWLLGGAGLFLLLRSMKNWDAALAGLIFYLFLPYGAIASRAFQPDPLLTAAVIWAWFGAWMWLKSMSWKWTIMAGLLSGFAVLVKSTAVFFLVFPFLLIVLFSRNFFKVIRSGKWWVMAILAALPYACYHIYGYYITKELVSQFSLRFFPQLWLKPAFYLQWFGQISGTVGLPWFLMAILGIFLSRDKESRIWMMGVLMGYFAYGMTFSYHITTHDYYHLPLIPWTALGFGMVFSELVNQMQGNRWLWKTAAAGVLLIFTALNAWDVRVTLKRQDYQSEIRVWQNLGAVLGKGASVVGLMHDYGYRLAYWGWEIPSNWMTLSDVRYRELGGQHIQFDDVFQDSVQGKQYFLVTLFNEYENQPQLKEKLESGYPIFRQTGDYIIYDLFNPLHP